MADRHLTNEDSPVSLGEMIGHYKRSKFMAEQVAIEAARAGQDVVIVNPTTPVGERDVKPTPTGRIVLDFLEEEVSRVRGDGIELGRRDRVRTRAYPGAGKREDAASGIFWAARI